MIVDLQPVRAYEPPPQPIWLISFADLISLLLCFFVMLFAMSSVELTRWRDVAASTGTPSAAGSLTGTGVTNVVNAPTPLASADPDELLRRRLGRNALGATVDNGAELDYLAAVLQRRIDEDGSLGAAIVSRLDDALVISLSIDGMFETARADLSPAAVPLFAALGRVLGNLRNQVDVRGYGETPEAARATGLNAVNNWELSIRRAERIGAELRRGGYAREPNVLGLGEARSSRRADLVVRAWRPETQVRVR
jgi:chemotaxis protein MotB